MPALTPSQEKENYLLLLEIRQKLENLIARTPTREKRNQLCGANIPLLSAEMGLKVTGT